ncbi:MAG: 16S rRNA (cytosine(1402)-N(4))-methyltransferase RsmH [Oscillospiraceae bacterium]
MNFKHISVMLDECIEGLNIKPDGVYLDGTAGGAGHSSEIANRLKDGMLIALDQDPDAIEIATKRLSQFKQAKVISANFRNMDVVLQDLGIEGVDGILLDLGVSSHQLDVLERGFSYKGEAPLDMRMSQNGLSAKDVVNTYSVNELTRILREYGEESFARRIAFNIEKARQTKEIETTYELAEIVKASIPAARRREKNPCKKTFQAIRIAVNSELDSLSEGLDKAFASLNSGGRLAILTFHSLEDRMVKHRYLEWCKGCTCPSEFPICICNNKPKAKLVNRKPIIATDEELEMNRRSKSAKLRVIEKI